MVSSSASDRPGARVNALTALPIRGRFVDKIIWIIVQVSGQKGHLFSMGKPEKADFSASGFVIECPYLDSRCIDQPGKGRIVVRILFLPLTLSTRLFR